MTMDNIASDFVKVNLRELKGALVAHARWRRVSLSRVVRDAVERVVSVGDAGELQAAAPSERQTDAQQLTKIWLRLTPGEVKLLEAASAKAGVSRSALVGELLRGAEVVVDASERRARRAALVASNAELAATTRNLRRLADLLGRSEFDAAQSYRALLDTVASDIKRHLKIAGDALTFGQLVEPGRRPVRPRAARRVR